MADGTPKNPAAVSGPGALSQRTDGGAGSSKQPLRVASGGAYGERKAAEAQQSAAPMAAGGGAPGGASPAGPAAATPGPGSGIFGGTERPAESNVAGAIQGDPAMMDPEAAIRVLYSKFPHPNLERMLDKRANYR